MASTTAPTTTSPMAEGPPYLPNTAAVGGAPTVPVDVPICSVLLALYLIAATIQTVIFHRNRKNKQQFRLSLFLIYMGLFRTITLSLRIGWATHLSNVSLAIAAQVFVTAGVLLLFVLNLVFVLRILRATHPRLAYHPLPTRLFQVFAALVVLSLIAVITCFIQSIYTLDTHTRQIDHGVTLYAASFFLATAFFPVLFVLFNYLALRRTKDTADLTQEAGPNSEKITVPAGRKNRIMAGSAVRGSIVMLLAALLLALGAGFRAGTSYAPARTADNPAWYHHKACFYIFNFATELAVLYLYTVVRVDKIFYVPDIAMESEMSEKSG
jgi:hypothetical protein